MQGFEIKGLLVPWLEVSIQRVWAKEKCKYFWILKGCKILIWERERERERELDHFGAHDTLSVLSVQIYYASKSYLIKTCM